MRDADASSAADGARPENSYAAPKRLV